MSIFAIYLNQPNKEAWDKLENVWSGRHFILDDRLALISPKDVALTSEIARTLGIGSHAGDPIFGFVAEISAYYGFNRRDLWEWLGRFRDE